MMWLKIVLVSCLLIGASKSAVNNSNSKIICYYDSSAFNKEGENNFQWKHKSAQEGSIKIKYD